MNQLESLLVDYYGSKLEILKKEKELSGKLLKLVENFLQEEGISSLTNSIDIEFASRYTLDSHDKKSLLSGVSLKLLED